MPTVTSLREHPRLPARVMVELDGSDIGAVPIELISELGLREDGDVSGEVERALRLAVQRTTLLDRALDLLAVRGRSVRELRLRLLRTKLAPPREDLNWVIERLERQGYLDDALYARQMAQSRMAGGVSRRRVQDELCRRGVPREVAIDAIDETLGDANVDEFGGALEAAQKKFRAMRSLDAATRRRRLYGFLARRGFASDVIGRVLHRVLNGSEEPDSTDLSVG